MITKIILYAFAFTFFAIEIVRWHRWELFNRKPFTCEPCLGFWVGFTLGGLYGYGFEAVLIGLLSGTFAAIAKKAIS